ncbi:unnamed protein product [Rotaria sp. Silwood2]|nr:unnamed protein product [Rotaria sp. Silwood2]
MAQELIRIGHKYGVIDAGEVLRSRHTAARTIYSVADVCREKIKQKLIEPLKQRAVTICPDFWTDKYKNISYLGLNLTYVDAYHQFFSIDLFCRPYLGIKSGDLIVKDLETHLRQFGIDDLAMVNILSDRGSNFVKGFRPYSPMFCFGHRLNNVLKTSFFQHEKKKKNTTLVSTTNVSSLSNSITITQGNKIAATSLVEIASSEEESEIDDEDILPSISIVRKKKISGQKSTNDAEKSLRKISSEDISNSAKQILFTISNCKKLSGLNIEIENSGGTTIHQSIDIRWISIIESLESILKSFKIVKKILISKQQSKFIMHVHEKTIKQILLLLRPFKQIIKLAQTGIKFFWDRIRNLLNEMFVLDIRHYAATLLHPKYRSLKACTLTERNECYAYVRQQMQLIPIESIAENEQRKNESMAKRLKVDLFSRFESDCFDVQQEGGGESGNESEEYSFEIKKKDELDVYLNLEIDKTKLPINPLLFWRDQQKKFPRLSRFARSIFSIPATSAAVERQFSGAGLTIQERRSNLNPEQLDNILLVRSMQKYEDFFKI